MLSHLFRVRSGLLAWIVLILAAGPSSAQVDSDERVVLFPTAARPSENGREWVVPVHGWIFEPEENDFLRRAAIGELKDALDLPKDAASTAFFEERAMLLLRDNESGERVPIEIQPGQIETFGPSDRDGHFEGTVRISMVEAERIADDGDLRLIVKLPAGDARVFEGVTELVPADGLSVISDIDDTIKDTGVTDPQRIVRSTFFERFRPVEGMAEVYSAWAARGASFHYVSSSPWHFYEPIAQLLKEEGFPRGAFSLKRFRLKDDGGSALLADPLTTKPPVIAAILEAWPGRKFVLVGDSGEKDPEVYGQVARKFGEQIDGIYIRDVTGEPATDQRYRSAFEGVPQEKWRLFTDPKELQNAVGELP